MLNNISENCYVLSLRSYPYQPTSTMYFCDDIKRHILSFLGAKPMKTTELEDISDLIHKWSRGRSVKSFIYHLRMRISFEQLQFEQSDVGVRAREKYIALRLEQCKRRDVQAELLQYHVLAAQDFNGVFRIPDSFHRVKWEAHILQLLLKGTTSWTLLESVRSAGKASANKFRRRERVCCVCCGKEVSRSSLSRHKKTHLA